MLNLRALGVADALTRDTAARWLWLHVVRKRRSKRSSSVWSGHPAQRLPAPESILRPGGPGPAPAPRWRGRRAESDLSPVVVRRPGDGMSHSNTSGGITNAPAAQSILCVFRRA